MSSFKNNFIGLLNNILWGSKMFFSERKKEAAVKIKERLLNELGEEEFKRLFEEARRNWIREVGAWPSPSEDDIILTLDYNLNEQKRKKALEKLIMPKLDFEGTKVDVSHDGKNWKIYYFPIDFFELDLQKFGRFLELIVEKGENVETIIPNMGWVPVSWIFGAEYQGIKGFAVVTKKCSV